MWKPADCILSGGEEPHTRLAVSLTQRLLHSAEINPQLCGALVVLPTFLQLPLPESVHCGHPFVTNDGVSGRKQL